MKLSLKSIGVAILSTNRPECTKRLINSIERTTATFGWKIFVMDDSESHIKPKVLSSCNRDWVQYCDTGEKIGVAQNTNRAMKVLEPYDYKIIFNNDVEVRKSNWAFFYPVSMIKTGFHHFCFQQEGLWGAGTEKRPEVIWDTKGCTIKTIKSFPQGAILVYDRLAAETVGYFDNDSFKGYGKSHWDWSFRVSDSGIQPEGIHDVVGSNDYFMVHDELCCTPTEKRIDDYARNSKILDELRTKKKRIFIPYG